LKNDNLKGKEEAQEEMASNITFCCIIFLRAVRTRRYVICMVTT